MKHISILGAGESGIGAAILAKKQKVPVFLSDHGIIPLDKKIILTRHEIDYEECKHSESIILQSDEVIKSPGIPDNVSIIQAIRKKSIPVISEIEFASRYTNAKKICITGSNGKTTTTLLTYHIMKKAKLNVGLAGNVGKSFARQVAEKDFEYYVIELSNFQLEGMFKFKPEIAVLLNITPDHLDRYVDFQQYVDAKFRIIRNQKSSEIFIYNLDDEIIANELRKKQIDAELIPFTLNKKLKKGAFIKKNKLQIILNKNPFTMNLNELALQGKHNTYNSMAAGIAARVLDLRKTVIKESLSDFQNIEHRLEEIATIHGILFINDSKATNVNAAWYALETMNRPVIWILGGQDKGNDYSMLQELVRAKVKAIVCLGKDNTKIHKAFEDIVETIIDTHSADDAVKAAYGIGKKGDVVLLAPACASFDLFKNFEDRGNQFRKAVKSL